MNCLEAEGNLCDYLDGALAPAGHAAMELHLSECPRCAALARDARAAMAFMSRADTVEPPPELVGRILLSAPWRRDARSSTRDGGVLAGFLNAMLAPRLAMGMAMTILSLSMLVKFAASSPQLTPSDLSPSRIWAGLEDRAYAAWTHTLKVYDNLRFVYEVETTIRQWQQEQDEEQRGDPNPKQDERKRPAAPAGQAPLSVIVGGGTGLQGPFQTARDSNPARLAGHWRFGTGQACLGFFQQSTMWGRMASCPTGTPGQEVERTPYELPEPS
jgi:Putative zinc-finger